MNLEVILCSGNVLSVILKNKKYNEFVINATLGGGGFGYTGTPIDDPRFPYYEGDIHRIDNCYISMERVGDYDIYMLACKEGWSEFDYLAILYVAKNKNITESDSDNIVLIDLDNFNQFGELALDIYNRLVDAEESAGLSPSIIKGILNRFGAYDVV